MSHTWTSAWLLLGALCLAGRGPARADEPTPAKAPSLDARFRALMKDFGKGGSEELVLLSGPKPVRMNRGDVPGREWRAKLGEVTFRFCIEDKVKMEAADLTATLQGIPAVYRKAYRIVSEEKKNGVAVYADLGGAAAHGSKDYLNIVPAANALVIAHEAGHVLEQYATQTDPHTLDQWKEAIVADGVSVSAYGDSVAHEDLAEFARIYAECLGGGAGPLAELKGLSPRRYELWERIVAVPYVDEQSRPKRPTLEGRFQPLMQDYGKRAADELVVLSPSKPVKMSRGGVRGYEGRARLGGVSFRICVEDKATRFAKDASATLERLPPAYRRALQIVSEGKKSGVSVYADLGGDAAQGSKDSLDLIPTADALVVAREAGRVLAQKASESDPTTLDRWKAALAGDDVSVSPRGDTAPAEDLAEFARVYAVCSSAGAEPLGELRKLSARRCDLWEKILGAAAK